MSKKLNVGSIGLGRLGSIYANHLKFRFPNANLVAIADVDKKLVEKQAKELDVPKWYSDPNELIVDKDIDAVVVVTPTSTHRNIVIEAAKNGKAIFCEKPLSISLQESLEMRQVVEQNGVFFQMGFQRRFDSGYAAAKEKLDQGVIGDPVLLKSSSRDPFRPSLEYADPRHSGGLIIDMAIHDFDVARFYMGDIEDVYSIAGTLAFPEMKKIGDVDNAVVALNFKSGKLGSIDVSRNGIYGYDIRAEILGTKGTLKIGYLRETPLMVMTKNAVTHDVVPFFMERFSEAYYVQLKNFVDNVLNDTEPPITIDDGVAALVASIAATRSHQEKRIVTITEIEESV